MYATHPFLTFTWRQIIQINGHQLHTLYFKRQSVYLLWKLIFTYNSLQHALFFPLWLDLTTIVPSFCFLQTYMHVFVYQIHIQLLTLDFLLHLRNYDVKFKTAHNLFNVLFLTFTFTICTSIQNTPYHVSKILSKKLIL